VLCLGLLAFAAAAQAQQVFQHRGVDSRVDYPSLTQIGPWDDRNYQLTAEDLKLLAPNEKALHAQIPAFFRVELRKGIPEMQRTGPVQYPRSALQIFQLMYGGFLVDGRIYQGAELRDGVYRVLMERGGKSEKEFWAEKFLDGEVRVTSPTGAAESAIKINPVDTDLVIAGSNGPGSGQKMHYSTDGGETWNAAAALPGGGTCCDPTVDWSSDGTLAYTATLGSCGGSGCQIWFYRSGDGGQTWTDLPGTTRRTLSSGNANDKEFIHVDKYPTSPHKDNIYATWHSSNILQFARSTDFGDTWASQAFSSATDQRGIGSDITSDKGGAVYYFWPAFNSQRILLRKSTNGGVSFGSVIEVASTEGSFAFPVPSMETREVFIYVSADVDYSNGPFGNSIYAAWSDSTGPTGGASSNHARIQVAYSRNGGSTWTVTTPHETADANSVDRYHQWLSVAEDGSVHVIFYDTRRSAGRTAVDVFYSHSEDGAQTWSTPTRITAQQSPNISDTFEFGDYNGMDLVVQDLIAIYTDNRNEGGGGGDSVDVYAAGLQLAGGCTPQPIADAGADRTIDEGDSTTLGTAAQAGHTYSWSPGGATAAQVSVSPTTTTTYTVTATTACGSDQDSVTVTVIPAGGGGPQNAVYNAGLGAPACLAVGSSCDTQSLVNGRANLGPEPNQPNTLNGCADGTSGTFHSDESNDRIVVSTLDGGNFSEGDTVRISATVWAWTTPTADSLDLFYAADANSPTWTFIATLTPPAAGQQTLTAQYTLPAGSLQAVRAQFRYQSTAAACSAGNYNDRDDVAFAVEGAGPECTVNADCNDGLFCNGTETCNAGSCQAGTAPNCNDGVSCTVDSCNESTDSCNNTPNNGLCDNGLFCDGTETCNATLGCQAGTAPNCNDGVGCTVDSCNEGTDSCNNTPNDGLCDNGLFCDGDEVCNATLGCQDGADPCTGGETCNEGADICEGGGGNGPQDAVYNAGLGAPACLVAGSECDSLALLDGRASLGPEPDQPNTLTVCNDGTSGTYHSDESNDRIVVRTLDGSDFSAGATVQIDATVYAWNTGSADTLDLYYAADANNPSWVFLTSIVPPGGGVRTLSAQYTLPSGSLQAVRAQFRYQGSASVCTSGAYNDRDDLVFAVSSAPPGGGCTVDDDFEGGTAGWFNDAASTCSTGDYVEGNPTSVVNGGVTTQVGGSHSGVTSLFTATNSAAGVDDVDGGNCILGSPAWAVSNASTLSVWWWHGQRDAGGDAGDFFRLEYSLNGGSTWTTLVTRGDVTSNAAWAEATASIPAGSNVRVRVQCSDGTAGGDLVECGIDDVSICE
jgi:hypothetical protein